MGGSPFSIPQTGLDANFPRRLASRLRASGIPGLELPDRTSRDRKGAILALMSPLPYGRGSSAMEGLVRNRLASRLWGTGWNEKVGPHASHPEAQGIMSAAAGIASRRR